ncbi:MAG: hypothetical protein ACE5JX_12620 [Acidobacteriota bacterium]
MRPSKRNAVSGDDSGAAVDGSREMGASSEVVENGLGLGIMTSGETVEGRLGECGEGTGRHRPEKGRNCRDLMFRGVFVRLAAEVILLLGRPA